MYDNISRVATTLVTLASLFLGKTFCFYIGLGLNSDSVLIEVFSKSCNDVAEARSSCDDFDFCEDRGQTKFELQLLFEKCLST
jgi:hypothetical protein